MEALTDLIQNPLFSEEEIEQEKHKFEQDFNERAKQLDTDVMESIHGAAYSHQTLGQSILPPLHILHKFNSAYLSDHVAKWYTPSRMVVAAVGIEHSQLVKFTESMLTKLNPDVSIEKVQAKYTGGEVRMHNSKVEEGQIPLTHFALAFETASWHDPDLVPMCVLQMMMGGGGSFSAGGPGKGMYSRLYENVLNRYEWANSATSFTSIHSDSSLFGFYGTCDPTKAPELVDTLVEESKKMAGEVGEVELQRAKNQLKSAVFMQLESRSLLLDDMGRQLLTYNKVQTPQEIGKLIDQVSQGDIVRVAEKMLQTNPSVAAAGDLSHLPRYDNIVNKLK